MVVEPAESAVLLGGQAGPHKIEGVGIGYIPPLWEPSLVDEIISVKTDDAKDMARRLAREEALFAGTSSGANVVAAIRVAEQLGPDATVVTLMVDNQKQMREYWRVAKSTGPCRHSGRRNPPVLGGSASALPFWRPARPSLALRFARSPSRF